MTSLTNRIALVTGASRGIGKSIALALAEAGADIAVNFNSNAAAAESVCQDIRAKGRRALPVQADVSKTQDVDRLISSIEKELSPPTILVNNAGIAEMLPAEKVTEAIFERFLRVNLTSMSSSSSASYPACAPPAGDASSTSLPSQPRRAASSAHTTPPPRPVSWA
jgi:3-oxoacyl-[acyl-carrier protein] reductase